MTHAVQLRRSSAGEGHGAQTRPVGPVVASGAEPGPLGAAADPARRPRWRRGLSLLFTVALAAFTIYMWPAALGGSMRIVIVSGHSMEPTYDFGDAVIVRGGGRAEVGDPVVFQVPDGAGQGLLVIHRIVGLDDEGYYVTQGDNRDEPDQWQLTDDDIVGEPRLHVPKGGHVVWFLQQGIVIAVVVGLLVVVVLWPKTGRLYEDPATDADPDPWPTTADRWGAADAPADVPADGRADLVASLLDEPWGEHTIDDAAMAEANAWLDRQLEAFARTADAGPELDTRTPAALLAVPS